MFKACGFDFALMGMSVNLREDEPVLVAVQNLCKLHKGLEDLKFESGEEAQSSSQRLDVRSGLSRRALSFFFSSLLGFFFLC